jgi:hypothetical protein
MLNPWDGCEQEGRLLRDGGEHVVIGIDVLTPPDDDPDDDRFAIGFRTATGRILRVRMPGDQLVPLGELLLRLADARRCLNQDGRQ